jgi:hypothetical protein
MPKSLVRKRVRKPSSGDTSARSTIILMIVVIVIAAYCVAFGLQTLVWFEARHWASANPWIKDAPQALNSPPVAPGTTELKAFDYEFKVPWTGKSKVQTEPSKMEFHFDAGPVIIFYDPAAQADMAQQLGSENPTQYQRVENALGQSFDTNYAIYSAVYGASPSGVSPFSSLSDAIRVNQLLLWKLAFGDDASPGIHSIQFGSNRGFEFGDPSTGQPVALRIFDGRDKQFRIVFLNAAGATTKFTQADIDSVVQSLQPVPFTER